MSTKTNSVDVSALIAQIRPQTVVTELPKNRLRCCVTGVSVGCAPEVFETRESQYKQDGLDIRKVYVSREGKQHLRTTFLNLPVKQAVDAIREAYNVTDAKSLEYPTDAQVAVIRKWGKDPNDNTPKTKGRKPDPEVAARKQKEAAEKAARKAAKEKAAAKKAKILEAEKAKIEKAKAKEAAKKNAVAGATTVKKVTTPAAKKPAAKKAPAAKPETAATPEVATTPATPEVDVNAPAEVATV